MANPIGKPEKKRDMKLDKRYKAGSSLKALLDPPGIPVGTEFQPGVRREFVAEMKKRRIGGPRNAR